MKQFRIADFGNARIHLIALIATITLYWPEAARAQNVEPETQDVQPGATPEREAPRRPAIDIEPAILQEFILTDNKDLDPEGEEDPGVISRTSLELNLHLEPTEGRLTTLGDARFALVFDTDEGEPDYEIDGLLGARAELLKDWFFVDAAGSATRTLTDGRGRVSGTGRTDDDQKVIYAGMLSPFVTMQLGNWSDAELRYRRVQVLADEGDDEDAGGGDEGTGDSSSDVVSLVTSTGDRFTRFDVTSELASERVRTEDEDGDLDWQIAALEGVYVLTRQFSLLASAGYDWVDTEDFGDDPEGPRLMGGFGFHPGPRSAIEISAGTRFGEFAVESFASYQITPRLLATASVVDGLETETSILAELPFQSSIDPETGTLIETMTGLPFEPGGFLTVSGLDEVALVRRYRGTLSGYRRFDTYTLNVFREEREMDIEADETVHGLFANWDRRLSPRLVLGAFATYGETDSDDGEDEDRTIIGGLNASYEWIQDLTFRLAYVHTRNDSDEEDDTYQENAIIFSVRKVF